MHVPTGHSRVEVVILCLAAALTSCGFTNQDGPDSAGFGEGHTYSRDTLVRFGKLLESDDWTLAEPPRSAEGMLEAVHAGTELTFVLIPAGSFLMGSPEDAKGRDGSKGPVHPVTVRPFLVCKTECTQSAWVRGGDSSEAWFAGMDRPEDSLTWTACRDWCGRNRLRLPTEAEWEYACRAKTTTPFSTGETLTTDQANFDGTWPYSGGMQGEHRRQTVAAGSLPANPWGLHEVHGNVWEWCEDTWHEDYEGAPQDGAAWVTADNLDDRIIRGGGWPFSAASCSSASRVGYPARERMYCLGFRPAADLPE